MKEKDLTRAERFDLMLYRQGKERSRAMPARAYGNPADYVEFSRFSSGKQDACVNILPIEKEDNMDVSEQGIADFVEPERDTPFMRCMKIWASWITLKDQRNVGGWSHPQDAKEFLRAGEAVEVMINDLPRVQWWAIRKAHGIAPGVEFAGDAPRRVGVSVWRFPDTSLPDALEAAESTMTPKMRNNIDLRRFFN